MMVQCMTFLRFKLEKRKIKITNYTFCNIVILISSIIPVQRERKYYQRYKMPTCFLFQTV